MHVLIEGGTVIDGTGNPGFQASVAVMGDRLRVIRGNTEHLVAATRIDAKGLIVAPGFIDMHSHSGLVLLEDGSHEAKVRQGVTTEVIGVDGNSYAPFPSSEELERFVRLNAGLDGRPDLDYTWNSVGDYLSRFDEAAAVNVAFLIGNSALRASTVGWDDRPASDQELRQMISLMTEGLEEGAFGVSTGLDYPPGSYASTDELVRLSSVAAEFGGIYHTHVRYQLGDRFLDPFREAIEIGHRSGVPIHITHLYRRANAPGGARRLLDLVDEARSDGLDVTFDTYPYEWSSTRLLMLIPMSLQAGGPDALLERLRDPRLRQGIREEVRRRSEQYGGINVWKRIRLGYFAEPAHQSYEGKTIADISAERDQEPADAICDLLEAEGLRVNQVAAGPDGLSIPQFVSHPLSMVGSDSVFLGAFPSPRTFGTFPRILGELVREERLLSLSEAVRKMTSYPAQRLGLESRGLIRDGMFADVTVFDADQIRALATYETPCRYAEGVHHVLVSGQLVLHDGRLTGVLPGGAIRRRGIG